MEKTDGIEKKYFNVSISVPNTVPHSHSQLQYNAQFAERIFLVFVDLDRWEDVDAEVVKCLARWGRVRTIGKEDGRTTWAMAGKVIQT